MQTKKKILKSDEEWKKELTAEQYEVTAQKGTEAPFTGKYYATKDKGMYHCVRCGNQLFSSETKFDSGTGWPSFSEPIEGEAVQTRSDDLLAMERTEVICSRCNAHLGHVFDDGPKVLPGGKEGTGKRYCLNSCALKLEASPEEVKGRKED